MRVQVLTLSLIAVATAAGLGTAVATTRTAPPVDPAAILMGVGNPHGTTAFAAADRGADTRGDLKEWENLYSRDIWPGMGVANVHTR